MRKIILILIIFFLCVLSSGIIANEKGYNLFKFSDLQLFKAKKVKDYEKIYENGVALGKIFFIAGTIAGPLGGLGLFGCLYTLLRESYGLWELFYILIFFIPIILSAALILVGLVFPIVGLCIWLVNSKKLKTYKEKQKISYMNENEELIIPFIIIKLQRG